MNSVQLIGRLTKDPEVRYTPTQMAIATFTVALDRGKDRDGKDKGTDFPMVTVFGKQAENCEKFLSKGRQVGIQGRLETSSYKKGEDTIFSMKVIADRVEFLDHKEKEPTPVAELTPPAELTADIPF